MTAATTMASIAAGVLLSCGASIAARADIPSRYILTEGTVLSTHIPEAQGCLATFWHLWVGRNNTVVGTVGEERTSRTWRLSGTYDFHGTFHLNDQELGGAERIGTVDAQVQSNGSLVLRLATIGDPSPCYNRTVFLPWFRNGSDFSPNPGGGGGGSAG